MSKKRFLSELTSSTSIASGELQRFSYSLRPVLVIFVIRKKLPAAQRQAILHRSAMIAGVEPYDWRERDDGLVVTFGFEDWETATSARRKLAEEGFDTVQLCREDEGHIDVEDDGPDPSGFCVGSNDRGEPVALAVRETYGDLYFIKVAEDVLWRGVGPPPVEGMIPIHRNGNPLDCHPTEFLLGGSGKPRRRTELPPAPVEGSSGGWDYGKLPSLRVRLSMISTGAL